MSRWTVVSITLSRATLEDTLNILEKRGYEIFKILDTCSHPEQHSKGCVTVVAHKRKRRKVVESDQPAPAGQS